MTAAECVRQRNTHLRLTLAAELSLGPRYRCPVCGEQLWTERSARTHWQEWWFTRDRRRHYKTRCNLSEVTP